MPVSYLSKPVETSPYVLPVDLNLLAKVNSYKQSMFYQNAQKVQDQLGALSNLDIANPAQKEYLNNAVNNVTQKINDYGPVDYSDMNVANSIENLGSEVYKDDNIINGIASTKKMRQIQSNYQKMANDPKLNKFYSTAYETYDYEHYIKPYVNNPSIKATYDGPTNPTIYTGNPLEKAAKVIKQAHPEITAEVVNGQATGGYINVQTHERYTPEQLASTFDSLVDGQTKAELVKNAWYTLDYSNRKEDGTPVYNEDNYVKMLHDQEDNQLENLQTELKAQNRVVLTAGLDNESRQLAQNRAKQLTETIANLKEASSANELAFRNTFKKDKDAALYQLYTNGIKHDLYTIFGAEQTKVSLKADLGQLYQHQKELAYIHKGLKFEGYNADGTPKLTALAPDKIPIDIKSQFSNLAINTENDDQAKAHAVTVNSLNTENDQVYNELNSAMKDMVLEDALKTKDDGSGSLYEALQYKLQPTTDANSSPTTYSSTVLTKMAALDSDKNLSIADFQKVAADRGLQTSLGLNNQAVDYIQGVVNSYDKLVKGVDNDAKIGENVRKYMDIYKDKTSIIESNKSLLNQFTNKVTEEVSGKLTPTERATLKDYLNDPTKYPSKFETIPGAGAAGAAGGGGGGRFEMVDPRIAPILKKLDVGGTSGLNDLVNKELSATSNRSNYLQIVLREDNDKLKVKELVPGLENLIRLQNRDAFNGEKIKDETIQPIALTKTPTGWRVSYTVKNGKDELFYSSENGSGRNVDNLKDVILSNEDAKLLGAQVIPYEGLERKAYVTGSAEKDYFVPDFYNIKSDGSVAKNAKPVRIQVYKTTNTRNDNKYAVKLYVPSLNVWKTIPYDPGQEKYGANANSAYYYATKLLDAYSKNNTTGIGKQVTDKDGNINVVRNPETFYNDYIKPRE